MDLEFSESDMAFQEEVRAFFATEYPADIREKSAQGVQLSKVDQKRWHKILYDKGWAAPDWLPEHGGTDWSISKGFIFDREFSRSGAPRLRGQNINMIGPVLQRHGSDEQKEQFLDATLSGEILWTQGYSERGSGSDLASLKTEAIRDGDDYVVNGHKIWTSLAQFADWIFVLTRTSSKGKKQEGITFLLADVNTPGIDIHPIISMDGFHHFNEVFFTDVRIPVAQRVGPENQGWTVAKNLLQTERTGSGRVAGLLTSLARLKRVATAEKSDDVPLIEDPVFKEKIEAVELEIRGLEYTEFRNLATMQAGGLPGPGFSSYLKVRGSEAGQSLQTLMVEAIGYYANPYIRESFLEGSNETTIGPDYAKTVMTGYTMGRAGTIAAGTSEVMRNIMAKQVLGL